MIEGQNRIENDADDERDQEGRMIDQREPADDGADS